MNTAITVISAEQVGIDEYRNIKTTKVFNDHTTLGEIKDWIINIQRIKKHRYEIGLSGIDISDVVE